MRGMGADVFFSPSPAPATASQDETPVSQHAVMSATQQDGKLVKATFYLTPEHLLTLERLRLARKEQGQKVDKSALVREAIERLQS